MMILKPGGEEFMSGLPVLLLGVSSFASGLFRGGGGKKRAGAHCKTRCAVERGRAY